VRRHYPGEVGEFLIFWCAISLGYCAPKIIEIDLVFTVIQNLRGAFFRHIVGPFPEHDFSRGGVKINISRYMIKLDFWPWPLLQKCFPRAWWSYSIRPGLEQDTASAMLFCLLMVLSTLRMTIDKYTVSDCRRGVSLLFISVAIDSGLLVNRVRIDKLTYWG